MKKTGIIILVVLVIAVAIYFFMKKKKDNTVSDKTPGKEGPLSAKVDLSDANGMKTGMSLQEDPLTGESAWVVDNKSGADGRNGGAASSVVDNKSGADGRNGGGNTSTPIINIAGPQPGMTMNGQSIPRTSNPRLQTPTITPKTMTGFMMPVRGTRPNERSRPISFNMPRR